MLIVVMGVVAYFTQSFGPWWSGIAGAFVIAAIAQLKPGQSFVAGFIGIGLAWAIQILILDINNEGILSEKVGQLFGGISGTVLVLITCLLGALLGGLAGMSGSAGTRWIIGKP